MNKRPLLPAFLILSLIFTISAAAQTQDVGKATAKPGVATKAPSSEVVKAEDIEVDVAQALAVIENNHVAGKKINYNDVVKSSIDGMLHSLDPHSNYFDAKEFEQFRTDQSSRYFGIGRRSAI